MGSPAAFDYIVSHGTAGTRLGRVEAFDAERGLGVVIADSGASLGFHSTAIADGSRKIAVGRSVSFSVAAGLGGRYEASSIRPL
jgi:cold shock CspA family protein